MECWKCQVREMWETGDNRYMQSKLGDQDSNPEPLAPREIGCLMSHDTIFQLYVWRHIDVQAD